MHIQITFLFVLNFIDKELKQNDLIVLPATSFTVFINIQCIHW